MIGRARAFISGEVIEGDKCAAHYGTTERSGLRIPDLPGSRAAQPSVIECTSICGAHFAKITAPHRVAGNSSSGCAQACLTRPVVVEKEESLVLDDGAADSETVVVAAQRRNGLARPVGEPVVRIQAGVTKELVPASLKFIRT